MLYDAVVVGAGPAGAMAAHELARGRARVLIVEKARLPRYKPCGGGLTPRARAISPLVAEYRPLALADTIVVPYRDRELTCRVPSPLAMVMRDQFDAYLTKQAVAAGAELRDSTALSQVTIERSEVRLVAGGTSIRARYLIGADGALGSTSRLAGLSTAVGIGVPAIEVELEVSDGAGERYAGSTLIDVQSVPGGYGWVFGKGAQLSVGVAAFLPSQRRVLRGSLDRFLAGHSGLRGARTLLQRGHIIPLGGRRRQCYRERVLLAGDAAGLADPLTGEGISYALASGRRAARAVLDALGSDVTAMARYQRFVDQTLGSNIRYAGWIAALAYRYPAPLLEALAAREDLRSLAARAISGATPYEALAKMVIIRAPRLIPYIASAHRSGGMRCSEHM